MKEVWSAIEIDFDRIICKKAICYDSLKQDTIILL